MKTWVVCLVGVLFLTTMMTGCNCGGDTGLKTFECETAKECEKEQACQNGKCVKDDKDGDGVSTAKDCDDNDPNIYPGRVEVCGNNKDDNCDGQVDEKGCRCQAGDTRECGKSTGACTAGTQECRADGSWTECKGGLNPEKETCNGVDDDCNGQIDDTFPQLGKPCEVGTGECKATGTFKCADDRKAAVCDAKALAPKDETCDGKDNDCDGLIDEIKECQTRFLRASTFACVGHVGTSGGRTFIGVLGQASATNVTKATSTSAGRTLQGGFLSQVILKPSP